MKIKMRYEMLRRERMKVCVMVTVKVITIVRTNEGIKEIYILYDNSNYNFKKQDSTIQE